MKISLLSVSFIYIIFLTTLEAGLIFDPPHFTNLPSKPDKWYSGQRVNFCISIESPITRSRLKNINPNNLKIVLQKAKYRKLKWFEGYPFLRKTISMTNVGVDKERSKGEEVCLFGQVPKVKKEGKYSVKVKMSSWRYLGLRKKTIAYSRKPRIENIIFSYGSRVTVSPEPAFN